jgi:arylsulfatase A-like enzyme
MGFHGAVRLGVAFLLAAVGASPGAARAAAATPPSTVPAAVPSPPGPRPNIVFLLTDDQRWDSIGAAGNPIVRTPNLDRLARRGVLFENNFDTTPVCYASRATILTGQYNRRHQVDGFEDSLSADELARTYPLLLRAAGYTTGFIGKWGLGGELPAASFDHWLGFAGQGNYFDPGDPRHLTRRQGLQAAEFVHDAAEPFALTVAFKAPHVQDGGCSCTLPTDPADDALYVGDEIPRPATATDAHFAALPRFLRESEGRSRWFDQIATPAAEQEWWKDYYRLISGVDREVGRIVRALERRGVLGRTLIVFTSDNGLLIGEHGLTGKWLMFEESIRTPLVVVWPNLPASRRGTRQAAMALNVDLAPTLLDAAGLPPAPETQGRSLRPLVFGEAPADWRTDWFFEHHLVWPHIPPSEGVRGERFKYVRYTGRTPPYEQLFDLEADPHEEQDIVHTPAIHDQDPVFYDRTLAELRRRWRELAAAAERTAPAGPVAH